VRNASRLFVRETRAVAEHASSTQTAITRVREAQTTAPHANKKADEEITRIIASAKNNGAASQSNSDLISRIAQSAAMPAEPRRRHHTQAPPPPTPPSSPPSHPTIGVDERSPEDDEMGLLPSDEETDEDHDTRVDDDEAEWMTRVRDFKARSGVTHDSDDNQQ
jgi:ribosomal protein L22